MKRKVFFAGMLFVLAAFILGLHYFVGQRSGAIPFTDSGHAPQRIVSTSPAITEMLFALGVGHRVVGVSAHCTFPPQVTALPKVGGMVKPNVETIMALEPDLIVLDNLAAWMQPELARVNLPTLQLQTYTIDQILHSIKTLGQRLDVTEKAEWLAQTMQAQIDSAKVEVRDLPKKRVMMVVGRSPGTLSDIYVVGKQSFLNELLILAGGENIFGAMPLQYPKVSKEEILARAPDILIESAHGGELNPEIEARMKRTWQPLSSLPAVKHGRIFILNDEYLLIPGPRLVKTLEKFKTILHPQLAHE